MIKNLIAIVIIGLGILSVSSCRTQKDVLYFQNIQEVINNSADQYQSSTIQTGDLLNIIVSAPSREAAEPYNLLTPQGAGGGGGSQGSSGFLVNSKGEIDYPYLGTLKAEGKTPQDLGFEIKDSISKYIERPVVNVRIMNYRVVVLGEVNRPGIVESSNEKITIMEAIALSGDMSLYAIRDSVMLIRTVDGVRNQYSINMHDANLINSPYYYLKQNDIIYVRPTKSAAWEFNTRPITAVLAVLGFILTIVALFK